MRKLASDFPLLNGDVQTGNISADRCQHSFEPCLSIWGPADNLKCLLTITDLTDPQPVRLRMRFG